MRDVSNVILVSAVLLSTGCGAPVTSNPSVTTTSNGRN